MEASLEAIFPTKLEAYARIDEDAEAIEAEMPFTAFNVSLIEAPMLYVIEVILEATWCPTFVS